MAQWRHQFSGLTHGSKLADAEATLRTAAAALRAASPADLARKAKAIRRLAKRVLNLRVKLLRVRQNAYGSARDALAESVAGEAGVGGILAEFAAEDLLFSGADEPSANPN